MAGFGWTLNRDRNLNRFRKRPYPMPNIASHYPNPQIACRFCDQVFMSTQVLIHHIQTHIIEDEVVSRRQYEISLMLSQGDYHLLTNFPMASTPLRQPIQGFFDRPWPLHERNPFPVSTTTLPSLVFNSRLIPPQFWVKKFSQQRPEPSADLNPPFFAPKPPTHVPADPVRPQVGGANEDCNKKTSDDTETLDLTLRL
ncbi:hypothetical protein EZV62_000920 [Acer yangbiense]|uniref:C2H2-type domain-containing protein n=1 Tax=Acer yangbiense TaxID=1000413 RepID=A0A5C7ISV3_9ROSI|nr:hypothetical protein EZV62_000920 [Acer yangbiense]